MSEQKTDVKIIKCALCRDCLEGEELESLHKDNDGDPICADCNHVHYEFVCCKCKEYAPIEERDGIGALFVVVDEYEAEVAAGVYEILKHPYYASDMLSQWFYGDAINRISDSTHGVNSDDMWYPCGHLCKDCELKIKKEIKVSRLNAELNGGGR